MSVIPALPEWVQGSRYSGLRLQWVRRDGSLPDLSDATLSGKIRAVGNASATVLTGTIAPDVDNAAQGWFTFTPSSADVATAGVFEVQFTATFGTTPDRTFATSWTIREAL